MLRRPVFLILPTLVLGVAACDRAAIDPSLTPERAAQFRSAPSNTLPALFNEALQTAHKSMSVDALRDLAGTWEARQAEVEAAYSARDMAGVQMRLSALRAEEARVIMKVLGPQVVHRVLAESNEALIHARSRILEASRRGTDVTAAENVVRDINKLLSQATSLMNTDPARALTMASDVAGQLAAVNDLTIDLRRLHGVEERFAQIVGAVPSEDLRRHARLQSQAHAASRSGHRVVAHERLAAVRAEEIQLVLLATQNRASGELVEQVAGTIAELRPALDAMRANGMDVARTGRMLQTATDLYNRSRAAEAAGDHATALDLSSHAAGLLNSLRHLLFK
jgi:hypothetical protein